MAGRPVSQSRDTQHVVSRWICVDKHVVSGCIVRSIGPESQTRAAVWGSKCRFLGRYLAGGYSVGAGPGGRDLAGWLHRLTPGTCSPCAARPGRCKNACPGCEHSVHTYMYLRAGSCCWGARRRPAPGGLRTLHSPDTSLSGSSRRRTHYWQWQGDKGGLIAQ